MGVHGVCVCVRVRACVCVCVCLLFVCACYKHSESFARNICTHCENGTAFRPLATCAHKTCYTLGITRGALMCLVHFTLSLVVPVESCIRSLYC